MAPWDQERRSVLVLANAAAGSADDAQVQRALDVLRQGADAEVVVPGSQEDLAAAVAGVRGRDVVVLGGDGSVNALLRTVAGQERLDELGAVGIVPLGTGNDLARSRELPLEDPAEAARVALYGAPRTADLLRDDRGGVVVNAAHAGVSAQATAHAKDVKHLLGPAGYAIGAVRAGFTAPGKRLRVVVDGHQIEDGSRRVLMVSVALGTSIGGGAPLAPHASPDDAVADVIVATADGPLARAGYGLDLRRGEHLDRDDVRVVQGRHVQVVAASPEEAFLVNTDGEVEDRRTERTWALVPHCWRVRTPEGPS